MMADTPKITLDMDEKCWKCGHKGAAPNGLCLACIAEQVRERITATERRTAGGKH